MLCDTLDRSYRAGADAGTVFYRAVLRHIALQGTGQLTTDMV